MEEWKDIIGKEGYYQASSKGEIRSVDRIVKHWKGETQFRKGKIISQCLDTKGYLCVPLTIDGKSKTYAVARLVAEAFIPNPDNLPCVGHKDDNRLNNDVSNLYWTTHKENNNHGKHNERLSKALSNRSDMSKPIIRRLPSGDVETYPSIREAARQTGINDTSIKFCCSGKYKKTKDGSIWQLIYS